MNDGILTSGYAPPKMPSGLLERGDPVPMIDHRVWHPEAADWQRRVSVNGGAVSTSTLAAVSAFCARIDAAGIRDRFYRLNLFCGTGLKACMVPLYRSTSPGGPILGTSTDTNNNFVSGDYIETGSATGGLKGNGTKYLDTGLNLAAIGASVESVHLSAYCKNTEAVGSSRYIISSWSGGSGGPGLGWLGSGSEERFHYPGSAAIGSSTGQQGFLGGSASGTAGGYYRNGSAIGTAGLAGSGSFQNQNTYVFAANSTGGSAVLLSVARYIRGYSIGLSMTAPQWSFFNTAMQGFQSALARNV